MVAPVDDSGARFCKDFVAEIKGISKAKNTLLPKKFYLRGRFFEKKLRKKLLLAFTRGVATSPLEQKSFAELFFRKATPFFLKT
jgi:hypothetical protein